MKEINLVMCRSKETKGTVVYRDITDHAVPTLYIRKGYLPTPPPETIKIVITDGVVECDE